MAEENLRDGTLVRHKVLGYEGHIQGVTRIKELFTDRGQPLDDFRRKQTFQYRIVLEGESLRRIAPADDIEILESMVSAGRRKKGAQGRLSTTERKPPTGKGTVVVK